MGQRGEITAYAVGRTHREQSKRPIIAVFAGYAERTRQNPIDEKR
jgi:hypothetical protein